MVIDSKYLNSMTNEVAHVIRREREARGLSMSAVAERAGLSQQMVSYVERGMRIPTIDTLLRISIALEVDLADLIQRAQRAAARSTSKS
jgi:transcriptional regulator with XRE-family HTH domain